MSTYIRWEGKARETGTRVQVLDLLAEGSEFEAERDALTGKVVNRWATICMDHSWITTHSTSADAWALSAHPLTWCEVCSGQQPADEDEADAQVATAYQNLTTKGKALMAQIGNWRGSFFDDGIVENSGAWGEVLAGELDLQALGVKSVKGVAGVLNGTAKAGMWHVTPGDDSDFWSLTALGAQVAHYAASVA